MVSSLCHDIVVILPCNIHVVVISYQSLLIMDVLSLICANTVHIGAFPSAVNASQEKRLSQVFNVMFFLIQDGIKQGS